MKYKELINKSREELTAELTRLRKESVELGLKLRSGQLKNPRQLYGTKKDIARVLTALTSK